jgi:RNA polymerase sigma-70 factor (ECF subfamily)
VERSGEHSGGDEALVAAAKEGDSAAFEGLLRNHEAEVLRVVRLLGIPAADHEDVAQEVFIRVFRHLDSYRPGRSFGGWLYRIAVNACHDHRRRAARRSREEAASEQREAVDDRPGLEVLAGGSESRGLLEGALEALSERERAVFVLCEMEELPTREVARALQISSITVRRHLGRARRRLQEFLEKKSADL